MTPLTLTFIPLATSQELLYQSKNITQTDLMPRTSITTMTPTGIPTVTLNSGFEMPMVGFGTGVFLPDDQLVEAVLNGVKVGHRHFDTAALYGTERALGKAIAEAIRQGLVKSREELFVTSKLWCIDADGDLVVPAIKKSLENLGLEYLDLYLIHWPLRMKKKDIYFPFEKEDFLPMDMRSTWAAMEECQKLGLTKSIGVSNFSSKKVADLLAFATIPPAVNQVEMNPVWDQRKLRGFCKENGIQVAAYSPLGANGAPWGTMNVMNCPTLKEIAEAKGKTLPQICLRWVLEQGVIVISRSYNEGRMKENLQIFDWELSEEEKEKISKIPQKRGFPGEPFVSPSGPYKTVEEIWDEDI